MRRQLRTILIVGLTVGLMGFFLRSADLSRVWLEIRQARWDLLAGVLVVNSGAYLLRVLRWQCLLQPIGHARFATAFRATVIGFAVTSLLPGRVGEVLRPYLLARRERLSATATFATIILERLIDVMTVLLLFGLFLAFFDPGMAALDERLLDALKIGGLLAAIVAVGGFVVIVAAAGHPERIGRMMLRADRVLPGWIARGLAILSRKFTEGLAVVRQPGPLFAALAWSLPLWLAASLGIWLAAVAFHLDVPYTGSFLLLALVVIGVAVPTPAGIGSFHAAFQIGATTFYAAPNDSAVGAALVLHAASFVPVTILGIFFMAQEGVRLSRVRELMATSESASGDEGGRRTGPQIGPTREGDTFEGPLPMLIPPSADDKGRAR